MKQQELLAILNKGGSDLRPFFIETYAKDFPGKAVIEEEAFHYILCKYKIGVIRNNQGIILNYYIYEQITENDSGESKTESPDFKGESEITTSTTGGGQEKEPQEKEQPSGSEHDNLGQGRRVC